MLNWPDHALAPVLINRETVSCATLVLAESCAALIGLTESC
jgi:hypothetical protein